MVDLSDMLTTSGVALVRGTGSDRELFLSRRPSDRSFLGGFHGFFVGRTEPGDEEVPFALDHPFRAPAREAWGCAVRELFEEAGLLPLDEGWVVAWQEGNDARAPAGGWSAFRRGVVSGAIDFAEALCEAGLRIDPSALYPVGEWTTPSWADLDAHTEFFVCRVPAEALDALANHVEGDEHLEAVWEDPKRALEEWARGRRFYSTPIRMIVEGLAHHDRVRDAPLLPDPSARTPAMRELIEVTGGIRMLPLRTPTLPPATHTNAWIIGSDRAVVVDPGSDLPSQRGLLESALRDLERRGTELLSVILTHHHDDHVGGVAWLRRATGVEVWAHAETRDRIDEPELVDRTLEDEEELPLDASHRLRVLHTPGHAPGHLALLHEASRTLVGGDLVASEGTILVDPDDGDMGAYLESLARIAELEPRAILPAHGEVVTEPERLVEQYRSHRWEREGQVLEALRDAERPAGPDDLVAEVYSDKPESVWPIAVRSLESHLLHLVERGLARRVGEAFVSIRGDGD